MGMVHRFDHPEQSEDCYLSAYFDRSIGGVRIEGNLEGIRYLAEVCSKLAERSDEVDHQRSFFPHCHLLRGQELDESAFGECINVEICIV